MLGAGHWSQSFQEDTLGLAPMSPPSYRGRRTRSKYSPDCVGGKTLLGLKTCGQEGLELVLEGETKRMIKKKGTETKEAGREWGGKDESTRMTRVHMIQKLREL